MPLQIELPMPDPATCTREAFTAYHVRQQCPDDAVPKYRKLFTDLQHMLDLLGKNDAMKPNNQQTYNTPAASKNKVYFMWDFMGRSLGHLYNINPKLPKSQKAAWEDVYGRTMYGCVLIKDTTGMLDMMNATVGYKDDGGVDFGDEIKTLANNMG